MPTTSSSVSSNSTGSGSQAGAVGLYGWMGRTARVSLVSEFPTYFANVDFESPTNLTRLPGGVEMIFGASGFPITGGRTLYIGVIVDQVRVAAEIPMPTLTLSELYVSSSVGPGSGQSVTYTVLKSGASTPLTTVITGVSTGNFLTGQSVVFNAGDKFVVKVETSAGAAEAYHTFAVKAG